MRSLQLAKFGLVEQKTVASLPIRMRKKLEDREEWLGKPTRVGRDFEGKMKTNSKNGIRPKNKAQY